VFGSAYAAQLGGATRLVTAMLALQSHMSAEQRDYLQAAWPATIHDVRWFLCMLSKKNLTSTVC
jgi:hypothetical protein